MKRLLIIGHVWPEPNSSAAGTRMMQLVAFFKNEGYSIIFSAASQKSEFTENLEAIGIVTKAIVPNNSSFNDFLEELKPEIVLFDRFIMEEQFGWRITEICPNAIKILDTEDLHFLRKTREEAFRKDLNIEDIILNSEITKREIASIYRCDISLIISEVELELLKNKFNLPEKLLFYLPFMLTAPALETLEAIPGFRDRNHFISVGNFLHAPNWDAVLNLKTNIWPFIRKELPQAQLHIYGGYPGNKVFQLNNTKEGFLIKGHIKSIQEAIKNARVLLAPLRFGAGLKGKLIMAMQNGTPNVTTNIGAEGICGKLPWGGEIVTNSDDFIQQSVNLYTNADIWEKSQKKGFEILKRRFNLKTHWGRLKKRILELENQLLLERQQNFIGAMLRHHNHKSTTYLSKYIEMKNRLMEKTNKNTD